ncbi:RDD family protein [Variovorax boronicumulans]|uniref:RDD family protein n=1 Tax=Variovorax boronicumulans TaxID=436515 RepID=UPI0033958970
MEGQSQDARYAPPQSHVEDVVEPGGTQPGALASRGKRFFAAMLDGGIAVAVMWLLSVLTPINIWDDEGQSLWEPQVESAAIGFLLYLAMHGYLLATRGQTIGKLLLKIRIVRPDGSKPSIGRILGLRESLMFVAGVIPMAGQIFLFIDCLFIFRASRRCLHDQIADTIVVQA